MENQDKEEREPVQMDVEVPLTSSAPTTAKESLPTGNGKENGNGVGNGFVPLVTVVGFHHAR